MNIFYLSKNIEECAAQHVDSHCSKMIIEYAQLMSTAHRVLDGEMYYGKTKNGRKIKRWKVPEAARERLLYKASHVNHPSAIWVRENDMNYRWLYKLWQQLNEEFIYRGFKNGEYHETYKKLKGQLWFSPKNITRGLTTTPMAQAMPDDVKNQCSIVAYRDYYNKYKQHLAKWRNRPIPEWYSVV
jgi:hypothetical protein